MHKLFVGNISLNSSEADVQRWVETRGFLVETAEIIRDASTGRSRGFAVVVLKTPEQVEEAMTALNGQKMGARVIYIAVALSVRDKRSSSQAIAS
jgi:RNA recognition motif-containing protein